VTEPVVEVLADGAALAARAADEVLRAAAEALAARGTFSIALSGGNTPRETYRTLARRGSETDFARWEVFLADERVVPAADERSNGRLVRETLLAGAESPPRFHAVPTELGDPAAVARAYERELRGALERIDLVLLGVGTDGHTASLFPGDPALDETARWVAPAGLDTDLPRVTLTYPALAGARHIVLLARGAEKRAALRAVLAGEDLPLARVRGADPALWLVERSAWPG